MSWIGPVSYETANSEIKEFLDQKGKQLLDNKKLAVIFQNMEVFRSLEGAADRLDGEAQKLIGKREGDLIEYVISHKNKAPFCDAVYTKVLARDHGITDLDQAELSGRDRLIIRFAEAFVGGMPQLSEDLREAMKKEFTDEQIVVLTALACIVAADNYFDAALDIQY